MGYEEATRAMTHYHPYAEAGKTDTDAGMAICDRDLQSRRVSGEKETDIGILE